MKNIANKMLFLVIVIFFFLSSNLSAGELFADIDRDGKNESVQWKSFGSNDLGEYYQLLVIDNDGNILWKGPKEKSSNNPYVFASLHYGVSLPELLFDIDGDGFVELLAPEPQSDVSPTYYRQLRWKGNSFEKLLSRPLMMDSPVSNYFVWKNGEQIYGIWVSKFGEVTKEGFVKANISQYNSDGVYKSGIALLRFTPTGANVEQWIKPLSSPTS
ncbi:MAG: hypothetical protein WC253_06620 [Sulfurovaceae bacterium]|nr:hypothetical protein [Sulfurovaceae bacterium]